MMGGYPMMTWVFWSSLIGSLIWLVLVGVAVWAFVRWVNARTPGSAPHGVSAPSTGPSALEILRQRYARGEIDAPTFAEMRTQLESAGGQERPSDGSVRGAPAPSTMR